MAAKYLGSKYEQLKQAVRNGEVIYMDENGLIESLLETQSGTNNLGERELRPLVLGRKVSNGSDTYTGMETTAICASVIQTLSRDKQKDLLTELTLNLQIGIHEKYSQYVHLPYFDSS